MWAGWGGLRASIRARCGPGWCRGWADAWFDTPAGVAASLDQLASVRCRCRCRRRRYRRRCQRRRRRRRHRCGRHRHRRYLSAAARCVRAAAVAEATGCASSSSAAYTHRSLGTCTTNLTSASARLRRVSDAGVGAQGRWWLMCARTVLVGRLAPLHALRGRRVVAVLRRTARSSGGRHVSAAQV